MKASDNTIHGKMKCPVSAAWITLRPLGRPLPGNHPSLNQKMYRNTYASQKIGNETPRMAKIIALRSARERLRMADRIPMGMPTSIHTTAAPIPSIIVTGRRLKMSSRTEDIFKRLPVTMMLGMGAAVVWKLVGIPIGILSAIRRRSLADRSAMIFAILGVSLPIFWLAYVFLYIFWFRLGWLPGSGLPRGLSVIQAALTGHFILPWIVLSLAFMAFYARMTRGNLIETMSEDFIRTARAKGLSERRVIFRHGLRSALTPVVTMFGMDLGVLLGGAVITETVFDLDGIGRYLIQALQANDFPAVMGVVMFASFFIVVANLVVDVAYAFLDPRVRYT